MDKYKNILDEICHGRIEPVSRTEVNAVETADGVYFDLPCGIKDCVAMSWTKRRIALMSEEKWNQLFKSAREMMDEMPAMRKIMRCLMLTACFPEYEEGKGFCISKLLFHSLGDGEGWEYLEAGENETPFGYIVAVDGETGGA